MGHVSPVTVETSLTFPALDIVVEGSIDHTHGMHVKVAADMGILETMGQQRALCLGV